MTESRALLPERAQYLERLPARPINWEALSEAIRPECRGPYIDKARIAAEAGLWDAAVLYFWNEAMNDLRKKVLAYGIEYFTAPPNARLANEEDLRECLNDYELIEGCFQLGVISKEAWFFLQQCREIRNQYTAAHLSDSQIDTLEAQNFIKNCVKYVLTHEPPSPGFSIRDFIERLRNHDIQGMAQEINTAVHDQSPEIRKALLNRLFSEYIEVACPATLRANIETIVTSIWAMVDEAAHNELGQRYVRVRIGPSQDAALLAFGFFRLVEGLSAIPDAYRRPIFESYSRELLNAHVGSDNFHTEGPRAKELLALGPDVPKEATAAYVKAILLSFIGNTYGYSWAADPPNREMISMFGIECVRAMLHLLDTDRDVQLALTDSKPVERLKSLVELVLQRPTTPTHERKLTFYRDASVEEIQAQFRRKLVPGAL